MKFYQWFFLFRTKDKADKIKDLFNQEGEVIQRFWAITKGVPKPTQGTIDIPIGEAKVRKIYKVTLLIIQILDFFTLICFKDLTHLIMQ